MTNQKPVNKARRRFIKAGLGAGAALTLGALFRSCGEVEKKAAEVWEAPKAGFQPNAWIRIEPDSTVMVRVNHSEMGQGITTAFAMIVAEELDADLDTVRVEIAPAEAIYKNPEYGVQMTAGSTSVRTSWEILRKAGAAARSMLIRAAADTWKVSVAECSAENGHVIHQATGRTIPFGRLTERAARVPLPKQVRLKDPKAFQVIGRPMPLLDAGIKTEGRAVFGMDVRRPGMLVATVVHAPVIGAEVKAVHDRRTKALPFVRHVIPMKKGVAVVADTFWHARQGADLLEIEWTPPDEPVPDSDRLFARWKDMAQEEGKELFAEGDAEAGLEGAVKTVRAAYETPYQAHATPEPMNCTAHARKDGCDIWVPTQNQDAAQEAAARITGLPYDRIRVHTTFLGGGFGRRIEADYVAEAVRISKAVKAPVQLVWSREEDMKNDVFRPAGFHLLRAGLDRNNVPVAWEHKIIGPDHMARCLPELIPCMIPYWMPRPPRTVIGGLARRVLPGVVAGKKAAEGAAPPPYDIRNLRVRYVHDEPGVPTGFWRSVAFSSNVFVVEAFVDEMARAAGKDPFEFRHQLLSRDPRLRKVLETAASKGGWGESLPRGRGRGLAAYNFHDTRIALLADVTVSSDGEIRVPRVVCTVDCGMVINPQTVRDQMEGGIVFGLTAALKSHITLKNGEVEQSGFHDFPILRANEMPEVEVHLMSSHEPPSGIGESAVPGAAPAVANAVFQATGKRVRRLPIRPFRDATA